MTTREWLDAYADALDEEIVVADGFDDAILGVAEAWVAGGEQRSVVVYDRDRCIQVLMARDGMDREGAEEFFTVNTTGSYVGPGTPIFVLIPDAVRSRRLGPL